MGMVDSLLRHHQSGLGDISHLQQEIMHKPREKFKFRKYSYICLYDSSERSVSLLCYQGRIGQPRVFSSVVPLEIKSSFFSSSPSRGGDGAEGGHCPFNPIAKEEQTKAASLTFIK